MLTVLECDQLPVAEARGGDPEAWDALFKRYQLPLYVYVFELLHDDQESLDVVQESFVSAVRHIGRLREDAKFGSWLFGIAHQKCVQRWRKAGRATASLQEVGEAVLELEDDPSDLLIRQEQEEAFMRAINALPLPQRSALLLHFVEDFSLEEIAAITGVSVGTVKSRVHYGKRSLRQALVEGGET